MLNITLNSVHVQRSIFWPEVVVFFFVTFASSFPVRRHVAPSTVFRVHEPLINGSSGWTLTFINEITVVETPVGTDLELSLCLD